MSAIKSPHKGVSKARLRARLIKYGLGCMLLLVLGIVLHIYSRVLHTLTSARDVRLAGAKQGGRGGGSGDGGSSNVSGNFLRGRDLSTSGMGRLTPVAPPSPVLSHTTDLPPLAAPPAPAAPSLPGAANHSTLLLDDVQFAQAPVSLLMASYGESDGHGSCALDFGNALVRRWRDTKQSYCAGPTGISSAAGGGGVSAIGAASGVHSSIDCFLVRQTRHHGGGDNLCHMRNVAVDMGVFADRSVTQPVVQQYVSTQHMKQPYVPFRRGFVQGDCSPDPQLWRKEAMPGWNEDWTVNAFEKVGAARCDEWLDHRVLIVQRDTFANFFHDSEDLVNAFLALAILEWSLGSGPAGKGSSGGTQIFLTDLYPAGPFWELWSKAFSGGATGPGAVGGHPVLTAFDLGARFAGKRVCFRDVAVGIYGPAAPITVASWDTPCSRTALVRAYSDFVLRGMGLQVRPEPNPNSKSNPNLCIPSPYPHLRSFPGPRRPSLTTPSPSPRAP